MRNSIEIKLKTPHIRLITWRNLNIVNQIQNNLFPVLLNCIILHFIDQTLIMTIKGLQNS